MSNGAHISRTWVRHAGHESSAKEARVHRYEARISWKHNGVTFSDNRYGRRHEWSFDGGVTIAASSSPSSVSLPYSVA